MFVATQLALGAVERRGDDSSGWYIDYYDHAEPLATDDRRPGARCLLPRAPRFLAAKAWGGSRMVRTPARTAPVPFDGYIGFMALLLQKSSTKLATRSTRPAAMVT
jgi:hypothetical protein